MAQGPGFLSTVLDTTGERLKERFQMEQEVRRKQSDALIDAIHAVDENGKPRLSPEQIDQAWGELENLNKAKTAKDIIAKGREVVGMIHQHINPNKTVLQRQGQATKDQLSQQPQEAAPPTAPPMDAGATEGSTGGLTPPPPRTSEPTPMPMPAGQGSPTTPMPMPPGATGQPSPMAQTANAASGTPTPPPAKTSVGALVAAGSPGAQAQANAAAQQRDMTQREAAIQAEMADRQGKVAVATQNAVEEGKQRLEEKTRARRMTEADEMGLKGTQKAQYVQGNGSIAYKPYNLPTAQTGADVKQILQQRGEPITDVSGQPLEDDGYYNVHDTGGGLIVSKEQPDYSGTPQWALREQDNQWVRIIQDKKGHHAPQILPTDGLIPPSAQAIQGMREVAMIGLDGKIHMMPAEYARYKTGSRPGGAAAPAAGPTTPPTAPAGPTRPVGGGTGGPVAANNGGQGRVLDDVLTPGEMRRQSAFSTPINDFSGELFGNPETGFKGLLDLAPLMDNKDSRDKIGRAFRLITEGLEKSGTPAEGIGAAVGGFGANVNAGGLWQTIKNKTGITNAIAGSEVAVLDNLFGTGKNALSTDEKDFLARLLAVYSSAGNLRVAGRQSPAQASTEQIQTEIPIPGKNIGSSRDMKVKIRTMAEYMLRAAEAYKVNPQMLPAKDVWKQKSIDLGKELDGGKSGPTPPPQRTSTNSDYGPVEDISVDGKVMKARKNLKTGKYKPE